jgi:dinuclear metal center YbgI/SA1388 family protein
MAPINIPTINDIIQCIEEVAPISLQESWDNCGLLVGSGNEKATSALLTIDVTEAVIDEAIDNQCNLIIAHHPVIFSGIKKLTGKTDSERAIIKAIRNHIVIYAAHTNIDVASNGVSQKMAQVLGLKGIKVLAPQKGLLNKLVVFVPLSHADKVRKALFEAGAGTLGQYDSCSFNVPGTGTFRGGPGTSPFIGEKGVFHSEAEVRMETVVPTHLVSKVIAAMIEAHPYEEVAYDLYPIENPHPGIGLGVIGYLEEPMEALEFLEKVKKAFNCTALRYSPLLTGKISAIALCGGSGSSLIQEALRSKADVLITGDIKYHQFFEAENKIVLVDIGHYESEQFTKELFFEIVTNKFPKFALRLSKTQTNPVNYLF